MTFRDASITDHILVSPELVPLLLEVKTWDWFADHAALGAKLQLPAYQPVQKVWPLPGYIPWDDIDYESWRQYPYVLPDHSELGIDDQLDLWAQNYEHSFDQHMKRGMSALPQGCKGRCARKQPTVRGAAAPLPKTSRPGEVRLRDDGVAREGLKWFQQLRRLQSMLHAVRANKQTVDALEYRITLWRAIRKAKGFQPNFEQWWEHRPTSFAGLPRRFPTEPPNLDLMEGIFQDFHYNYRKLETWNIQQRKKLLALQYEAKHQKIFEVVRKEPRGGISYVETTRTTTVLGADPEGEQVHLDLEDKIQLPATINCGGGSLNVTQQDAEVLSVQGEWLIQAGCTVEVVEHSVTPEQILRRLETFWEKKWQLTQLPSEDEWNRILNFSAAFIPPGHMSYQSIGVDEWIDMQQEIWTQSCSWTRRS